MRMTWKNAAGLAATGVFMAMTAQVYAQNNANANGITPGQNSPTQMSSIDQRFAMEATEGGMAEVELGHLAVDKSQNDKVKQFGQRMIDDHSKANDELKAIASKDNIQLPASVNAKDQALKDKLNGMSGTQFDKMYTASMVRDHEKDIAEFQKEANNGTNPDLRSFATRTLPTLQEHLRLAQAADQALK